MYLLVSYILSTSERSCRRVEFFWFPISSVKYCFCPLKVPDSYLMWFYWSFDWYLHQVFTFPWFMVFNAIGYTLDTWERSWSWFGVCSHNTCVGTVACISHEGVLSHGFHAEPFGSVMSLREKHWPLKAGEIGLVGMWPGKPKRTWLQLGKKVRHWTYVR